MSQKFKAKEHRLDISMKSLCKNKSMPNRVVKGFLTTVLLVSLTGCAGKKEEPAIQAAPELGPKWGFIDHTGKFVIKPQFRRVFSFSEGDRKSVV